MQQQQQHTHIQSIGTGDRTLFAGNSAGGSGLKCPRCGCLNTKFCYYNNYNLSQPRFFCKGCRRYWTKGGVLRNVPVGGGTRKTKRSNHNITGDGKSTTSHNISPEMTPTETAPTLVKSHSSTDNHYLFSEMTSSSDELPERFRSVPEISFLTQQRDEDQDWGLFDESYWINNSDDHQLKYMI
ncbi:hypothetical protein QVD17_10580 [Tagetes erecta]|uniref:Dof zinc finger protein n=1 Tax=Tagetes erecta TaxID=13708 RepID=A0AAD8P6F2_TARER|nr:hypothetical protein QVD17_10580 [Tagetes erecta]